MSTNSKIPRITDLIIIVTWLTFAVGAIFFLVYKRYLIDFLSLMALLILYAFLALTYIGIHLIKKSRTFLIVVAVLLILLSVPILVVSGFVVLWAIAAGGGIDDPLFFLYVLAGILGLIFGVMAIRKIESMTVKEK